MAVLGARLGMACVLAMTATMVTRERMAFSVATANTSSNNGPRKFTELFSERMKQWPEDSVKANKKTLDNVCRLLRHFDERMARAAKALQSISDETPATRYDEIFHPNKHDRVARQSVKEAILGMVLKQMEKKGERLPSAKDPHWPKYAGLVNEMLEDMLKKPEVKAIFEDVLKARASLALMSAFFGQAELGLAKQVDDMLNALDELMLKGAAKEDIENLYFDFEAQLGRGQPEE